MTRRDWLKAIIAVPIAAVVPVKRFGLFNPKADLAGQYTADRPAFHPMAFEMVSASLDLDQFFKTGDVVTIGKSTAQRRVTNDHRSPIKLSPIIQ